MKAVLGDSRCRQSTAVRQFLAAPPPRVRRSLPSLPLQWLTKQPVVVVPRSVSEPVVGPFPSESLNPPAYQEHANRRMSRSDDEDPPPPPGGLIPENNNPFTLPLPPPGMRIPDRVLLSGREQSYLFPLLDSARENLGFISGIKVSIDRTPAAQVQDRVNIIESQQSRVNTAVVSLKVSCSAAGPPRATPDPICRVPYASSSRCWCSRPLLVRKHSRSSSSLH